jgi:hypothetical protein
MPADTQYDQIDIVRDRILGELLVGLAGQQLRPGGAASVGFPRNHVLEFLIELLKQGVLILTPLRP